MPHFQGKTQFFEQKNIIILVCCSKFYYLCNVITKIEQFGNIPVSTETIASLYPDIKAYVPDDLEVIPLLPQNISRRIRK